MKLLLLSTIVTLSLLCTSLAQNASRGDYYQGINPNNANFRQELRTLISRMKSISYAAVWAAFMKTDTDNTPNCGNRISDIYTNICWTPISKQCGTFQREGDCYNREHSWPKSWWGGDSNIPPYSDVFHLYPTDGYVNGKRSNHPYDEVVAPITYTSSNGGRLGKCKHAPASLCFEPANEFKGDVARSTFYMSVRYEGVMKCCDTVSTNKHNLKPWYQTLLRRWHEGDPVSPREKKRNQEIFLLQNNRNPFVDHPEWVRAIRDF